MMPLTLVKAGQTYCIRRISGPDEVRQHLAELGFVAGEPVTVLSAIGGNLILSVKGSRIALDNALASRIMIQRGTVNENTQGCKGWSHRNRGKGAWGWAREAANNGYGHN